MIYTIRPVEPNDYPSLVGLFEEFEPNFISSPEEVMRYDQNIPDGHFFQRLVAEFEGRIVGWCKAQHSLEYYHPQRLFMSGGVTKMYRKKGIGGELLRKSLEALSGLNPTVLWMMNIHENDQGTTEFLNKRGFSPVWRSWTANLDLPNSTLNEFSDLKKTLEQKGFSFRTYTQLEGDPQREEKYWKLEMSLSADMPTLDDNPYTSYAFEEFKRNFLDSEEFIPDGTLFCVSPEGELVGLNSLWRNGSNLRNGTTGTLEAYRRKGIATALKNINLEWAKSSGYDKIVTSNADVNEAMWAINQQMGFVREPATLIFRLEM